MMSKLMLACKIGGPDIETFLRSPHILLPSPSMAGPLICARVSAGVFSAEHCSLW